MDSALFLLYNAIMPKGEREREITCGWEDRKCFKEVALEKPHEDERDSTGRRPGGADGDIESLKSGSG